MNSMLPEAIEQAAAATDDELLYRRRKHGHEELITGLNLTAMMDVLTILLVYLIKVYADAPENITLNDDLRPPASTAPANIVPSVSVLISKSGILVDNKKVLDIDGGKIVAADPNQKYLPLAQALDKRVETIKAIAARGGSPFDGNLMIIADEDTQYDIISSVLYQAGRAEFTNYRLVVRKK
ncbi:MAG: ExbD/TolR family protein [Myxococcota bacterium]